MSKIVSVSQLKVGDKFAFVNGQSGGAPSPLNQESKTAFVVSRPPSVNLAANTCYFRYQSAAMSEDEAAHRESNQSFNGSPDMQVRLWGTDSADADPAGGPSAVATAKSSATAPVKLSATAPVKSSATAAGKSPPVVAEEPTAFAWPEKPTKKRAVSAKPKPTDEEPRAQTKSAKVAPPQPGTLRLAPSSAAKLEKPSTTAPAAPKSAPEPPLSKLPALKKVVFNETPAGKKPAPKKAAPKASAAKKPAKGKSAPKK
jgi:hypothetical protein